MNLIVPVPSDPAAAIELADTLLRTTVRILYETHGDADFPEHYVRSIAPTGMAGELHALRCLETDERRNQVAEHVNRLRAKLGLRRRRGGPLKRRSANLFDPFGVVHWQLPGERGRLGGLHQRPKPV